MSSTTLRIDRYSFTTTQKICGKSKQVMVYGFKHCCYMELFEELKKVNSGFQKVYNYTIGNEFLQNQQLKTLEGNVFTQIPSGMKTANSENQSIKRVCKAGITNLVCENIWRKREERLLIPLLFLIDIDENLYPVSPENILSKTKTSGKTSMNALISHAEIRRAYKLCTEHCLDPEVRAVALETMKFARVKKIQVSGTHAFEQINPPWEDSSWNYEWVQRKLYGGSKRKSEDWRKNVNAFVAGLKGVSSTISSLSSSSSSSSYSTSSSSIFSGPPPLLRFSSSSFSSSSSSDPSSIISTSSSSSPANSSAQSSNSPDPFVFDIKSWMGM